MFKVSRTNSSNPDFIVLVKRLDAYLAITDGDEHAFYNQFNKIDKINHVVVFYENDLAIACGAVKQVETSATWEIKRMFVTDEMRGKGIASMLLQELELWAKDLNVEKLILETGKRQVEAVALYHKNGYAITENFGQYVGVENSICFEKMLK
ncbi:GNAT family N-acetyltransferase [Lacihabitans sp. CCS-44]|uniref:GNAT family N-acetyltransferase n=1 Tax=Lacihabitans sp. CCS-44 TaxID=2487331 RepID=UPI0020CC5D74|nr:GNAT family N-acetyltransferase [Lacihabitans sp. CCS-44]MCP9753837.1 GNAT family N-acetyltransferase [Lacihabitans sp. CCS-44]